MTENTKTEVFKIQRAIVDGSLIKGYTIEGHTKLFIYNKNRSVYGELYVKNEEVEELFGDEYKVYVKGKLENGTLIIEECIEPQKW